MDSISSSTKFIASDGNTKNYMIIILVALLILSLLGINFFIIVWNIVQVVINIFKPLIYQILAIFGYTAGTLLNKTADITSDVARAGVDIAEGSVQSVGNLHICSFYASFFHPFFHTGSLYYHYFRVSIVTNFRFTTGQNHQTHSDSVNNFRKPSQIRKRKQEIRPFSSMRPHHIRN